MILKKNTAKEFRDFSFLVITVLIIIIGFNLKSSSVEESLGITFIFGLPILLGIIGFLRGLKKVPIGLEIKEEKFLVSYNSNREEEIYFNNVSKVTVNIHSPKTAFLEIIYFDLNGKQEILKCWKKYHENFTQFSQKLISIISDPNITAVNLADEKGKNRKEYNLDEVWTDHLEKERSFKVLFKELNQESLLKKIGVLLVFGILFLLKTIGSEIELKILVWVVGIVYLLYLISGSILRINGYSRRESISIFFSRLFFGLFGLGATCIIIMEIFE